MNYSEIFAQRSKLHSFLCGFLEEMGVMRAFLPVISKTSTNESYTDLFRAVSCEDETQEFYMHPSPEFQLKKLMAKESSPFYYLGPVFRAEEPKESPIHTPEFEMLEWYEFNQTFDKFIDNTKQMLQRAINEFLLPDYLKGEFFETTWRELFLKVGVDIIALRDLCKKSKANAIKDYLEKKDDFDTAFYKIYYNEIYESTKDGRLWIIKDFPIEQSALAKSKNENFAERFEIYWNGVELVNGYNEENRKDKMEKILIDNSVARKKLKKRHIEIDTLFLDSLEILPPLMCGASLGVDRLLYLLLCRNKHIRSIKDLGFFNF